MAKTKFGVGDKVSTDTGFTPYEGPLPKPGVIYPVTQKQAVLRLTGQNAKTPDVEYIRGLWEITSGECKGFTVWHNIVPGESEFQQARIAQYMQAVCGKNSAEITHDKIDDGGKITKIGTRNPVGVTAGMTFQRKKDAYGVGEGEEPQWKAESNDIIPGWKPKGGSTAPLPDEDEEPDDLDEEDYEDEEEEDAPAEPEDAPAPTSRRRKAAPVAEPEPEEEAEPEEDGDDEEEPEDAGEDGDSEDEDDVVSYEDAAAMSLVELKKLAGEFEYTPAELAPYKGPKGKKDLLKKLIDDEIVEAEGEDGEPPF